MHSHHVSCSLWWHLGPLTGILTCSSQEWWCDCYKSGAWIRLTFGLAARRKGLATGLTMLKFGYVLGGKPSSSGSPSDTLLWNCEISPAVCALQADLFSHLQCFFFLMGNGHNEALRFIMKDWESGLQSWSWLGELSQVTKLARASCFSIKWSYSQISGAEGFTEI